MLFPGASVVPAICALGAVLAVAIYLCDRISADTLGAKIVVLGAWTLLGIGLAVNVWYFTTASGGSVTAPVLFNDDASTAWNQMLALRDGVPVAEMATSRSGYSMFLVALSWPGTPSITTFLIVNVFFVLLAIVLTGGIARRLSPTGDSKIAVTAMVMIAMVCYFLSSGVILIKDACMCAVMAAFTYSIVGLNNKANASDMLVAVAAMMLGALVRPNVLPFMALGIVFFVFTMPRGSRYFGLVFIIATISLYVLTRHYGTSPEALTVDGKTMVMIGSDRPRMLAYTSVLGAYEQMSPLQMLLRLPVSLALQFITPLPWAFGRDIVFGPSSAYSHIAFPWYAVGGVILYALLFKLRAMPRATAILLAYGVALYVVTAYMTGGTVSRYTLPWLPTLVPAAAWAWNAGCRHWRSFKIWYTAYCVLMAIALAGAFLILNHYTPGGWVAQ